MYDQIHKCYEIIYHMNYFLMKKLFIEDRSMSLIGCFLIKHKHELRWFWLKAVSNSNTHTPDIMYFPHNWKKMYNVILGREIFLWWENKRQVPLIHWPIRHERYRCVRNRIKPYTYTVTVTVSWLPPPVRSAATPTCVMPRGAANQVWQRGHSLPTG